jgi:hypothetical protein
MDRTICCLHLEIVLPSTGQILGRGHSTLLHRSAWVSVFTIIYVGLVLYACSGGDSDEESCLVYSGASWRLSELLGSCRRWTALHRSAWVSVFTIIYVGLVLYAWAMTVILSIRPLITAALAHTVEIQGRVTT